MERNDKKRRELRNERNPTDFVSNPIIITKQIGERVKGEERILI